VESPITIRRLERADAASIVAIQSSCPELAQWSQHDYEAMAAGNPIGWVALRSVNATVADPNRSPIIGFITARIAADEMEILNLAVTWDKRRLGAASALLQAAMSWGIAKLARRAFLEVRASNLPALRFYAKAGFKPAGRRANYYTSPPEDALQLAAEIR
jgi:[ribosomal protein S18]-alanine N-acetyltransferase